MNRLTDTLNSILARKGDILSILRMNYTQVVGNCKSPRQCLLLVWNDVVSRASRKYSRSWERLFLAMDAVMNVIYTNEDTRETTLSLFRKALRSGRFDPIVYTRSTHLMGVSRERARERRAEYTREVSERNNDRGSLVPIFIEQIVELIQKLIPSQDIYEQIVAVLLATGSRSIEVFRVSTYSQAPVPHQVIIKGLAKDKGSLFSPGPEVVLIRNIVGIEGSRVVEAVREIRDKLRDDKLTNQQVATRHNKRLNRVFRKYIIPLFQANAGVNRETREFREQIKNISAHKARYISGNASWLIYGRPKNIPETPYLQGQYGHQSADSTKSYLAVQVKFKPQEAVEAVEADLNLTDLVNTRKQGISPEEKVSKFLDAIKRLKNANRVVNQKELRKTLRYSARVASEAYKKARARGLL